VQLVVGGGAQGTCAPPKNVILLQFDCFEVYIINNITKMLYVHTALLRKTAEIQKKKSTEISTTIGTYMFNII